MPLPFEGFQGQGVLDFSAGSDSLFPLLLHPQKWTRDRENCYVGSTEPTSVLDSRRSPNHSTSSSTMSSSTTSKGSGGGGGGGVAAPTLSQNYPPWEEEKCGLPMEDWEGQGQSILRLIMGDVEDPSAGLSKLFHSTGNGSHNVDFNGGFGVLDQGLNMVSILDPSVQGNYPGFSFIAENIDGHNAKNGSVSVAESNFPGFGNNSLMSSSPGMFNSQQHQGIGEVDEKPQVINPQFLLNQNQVQFPENPSFFVPLRYPQVQEQQVLSQNQAKRLPFDTVGHNYQAQVPKLPLLDSGQEVFVKRHQTQLPLFPHHMQQLQSLMVPSAKQEKVDSTGDDVNNQLQQSIFDQLYKTAELIEAGNPVHAQGILARLNHQLSPNGKPFHRAAFYMKEALQSMLHSNGHNFLTFSPISFIFKIGAYKSFSEISPVLQFANFTCNQALIEAVERFDRIHIIDFDIGFGVQWSSFMQELALMMSSGVPSLKVTAVVSPSTCDEMELNLTQENLSQFAKDINMCFELNVLSIESLNSFQFFDDEAIAVNMPVSCLANYPSLSPSILQFVKQLRPKVVVTMDRNCDRIDVPFATNVAHALQCYSALLDSLDAVNVNLDILQKIERHFILPDMKKTIFGHNHSHEKLPPWRSMFLQYGFSPFTFSNFTESQAECLVQRAPVRGFQLERKHSSFVLCWQQKELISVSTWRC